MNTLIKDCLASETLMLKRDAQVMLIKNINKNYVNESRGVVVGFEINGQSYYNGEDESVNFDLEDEILPIVKFTDNRTMIIRESKWDLENSGTVLASRRQVYIYIYFFFFIFRSLYMFT